MKILILFLFIFNYLKCNEDVLKDKKHTNSLINETSPYLLQHAHNPVNWYPWSDEAFELANKEDKPIFLSIGYSTCHWCHVMEHESFENEEVAKMMNKTFINIKVDREERPDIDNIYMTICQMLTGSGGWPLTIIMTPEKKPFFAGTYFPPTTRFGRIGMLDLIPKIDSVWRNDKQTIIENADEISNALKNASSPTSEGEFDTTIFSMAYDEFLNIYDEQFGGFGQKPKFPTPHQLNFLLRHYKNTGKEVALEMVENTLINMRMGGIYDHIGKGFHRYSTDRQWLLPHFEKMLYDQATLMSAYSETYLITKDEFYLRTAKDILDYVVRDLKSKDGAFYSAEDADSEGLEGKFYVWEKSEIEKILGKDSDFFCNVFNIYPNGNYTEEAAGHGAGGNIPHLKKGIKEIADEYKINEKEVLNKIESLRKKLFDLREKRVHPFKDDKILTDWNSLFISSIVKLYDCNNDANTLQYAIDAENFIYKNLFKNNELYHVYGKNGASIIANLDDYAFYIQSLIDLYQATFNIDYLKRAITLTDKSLVEFYSLVDKAFYFTSSNAEELLVRKIEVYDGAIASGNSIMILNLLKLSKITANEKYSNVANDMINSFSNLSRRSPTSFTQYLVACDFAYNQSYEIVIVGDKLKNEKIKNMLKEIRSNFIPNKVLVWKEDKENTEIEKIAEYSKMMYSINNLPTIYVCKNFMCENPTNDMDLVRKYLNLKK
jgi:uncharacterized protein YyaL (SSP411 family)